jgi:hypothetical protein
MRLLCPLPAPVHGLLDGVLDCLLCALVLSGGICALAVPDVLSVLGVLGETGVASARAYVPTYILACLVFLDAWCAWCAWCACCCWCAWCAWPGAIGVAGVPGVPGVLGVFGVPGAPGVCPWGAIHSLLGFDSMVRLHWLFGPK